MKEAIRLAHCLSNSKTGENFSVAKHATTIQTLKTFESHAFDSFLNWLHIGSIVYITNSPKIPFNFGILRFSYACNRIYVEHYLQKFYAGIEWCVKTFQNCTIVFEMNGKLSSILHVHRLYSNMRQEKAKRIF